MTEGLRPSLIDTAKTHWRAFAPVWAFPLVFLVGGIAAGEIGYPDLFFWLIAMPLFFWSFFRAVAACRRAQLSFWHCAFWIVLVPFAVWVIAVEFRLLTLNMLGAEHAV